MTRLFTFVPMMGQKVKTDLSIKGSRCFVALNRDPEIKDRRVFFYYGGRVENSEIQSALLEKRKSLQEELDVLDLLLFD